jgi:hypothetical protein
MGATELPSSSVSSSMPTGRLQRFLGYAQLDLSRPISSNIVSAKTLFFIRLVITLHLVAVFIATLYVSARDNVFYMVPTTFTNLSNMGLTAYYLVTSSSFSISHVQEP